MRDYETLSGQELEPGALAAQASALLRFEGPDLRRALEIFIEGALDQAAESGPAAAIPHLPDSIRSSPFEQARLQGAIIEAAKASVSPDHLQAFSAAVHGHVRRLFPLSGSVTEQTGLFQQLMRGETRLLSGAARQLAGVLAAVDAATGEPWCVLTPRGRVVYLNSAAMSWLGVEGPEIEAGLNFYAFFTWESLESLRLRVKAAAPGGGQRANVRLQPLPRTLDGEAPPERVEVRIEALPVDNGQDGLLLAAFRAMPDTRAGKAETATEMAVPLEADAVQRLFDAAPMGILTLDAEGRIQSANPRAAQLWGAPSASALRGLPIYSHDGGNDDVSRVFHIEAAQGHAAQSRIYELVSIYGQHVYAEGTLLPLPGADGQAPGLLVLLLDAREKAVLEGQLRQSEKLPALVGIVGGVAHELNNPLTTILGYAEFLLTMETPGPMRARLANISEEAERCRKIVQNLLSFSVQGAKKKTRESVPRLLQEALELHRYQLDIDGIRMALETEQDLPEIPVHARELQRVFLNLLTNAHHALLQNESRERWLRVSAGRTRDSIHIRFADNGPGFSEAVGRRIFDPFFTTRPRGESLGLGLSVAFGVIQEHGGRIWFDSVEGEGATFHIELPIDQGG